MEHKPVKTVDLKFTVLKFYETYVISTLVENAVLDQKCVETLTTVCLLFFQERNFTYVSHRVTEYNVQPTIYLNLNQISTLKGIAVVSENPSARKLANFEKKFSPIPYEVFLEMEDAIEWALEMVKE